MAILLSILIGFGAGVLVSGWHRCGRAGSGWLAALAPVGAGLLLMPAGGAVAAGEQVRVAWPWVSALNVDLAFRVDGLGLLFAWLVCLLGALIMVYADAYMRDHPYGGRFYGFMLAFMASMLGFVLADNLFTLYIFFELTSLFSFFLIGINGESAAARRAARQALLVTNLGGLALLAGLLLLGQATGVHTLSALPAVADTARASHLYLPILLLVLLAAFTKSAQVPFHFWLPNAMEAPTPVSAYLHSATMVKAGVYLLARFLPVLGGTLAWQAIVGTVGAVTMLVAAWLALRHRDLKRILAYTTVMALGLITMLLGVGTRAAVAAALLYVLVHACYKGALFLVAGAIDHGTGCRDVARLGGLRQAMPWIFAGAALAGLSMAGLPPFVGFLGKELAYEALFEWNGSWRWLLVAAVLANVAVVAIAAVLVIKPFLGPTTEVTAHAHGAPLPFWLGPLVLGGLGLVLGGFPGLVDERLLGPATAAALGQSAEVHLALWHGLTPALAASGAALLLAGAVYVAWPRLRESRALRGFATLFGEVPDRAFEAILHGVAGLAGWQTRLLQQGRLRIYLAVIFGTAVALIGLALALIDGLRLAPLDLTDVRWHEWILVGAIAVAALVLLVLRSRLAVILTLSLVSYLIALLYLLFGAPDLVITQLLVETLMAILVVLAFYDLPRIKEWGSSRTVVRDGLLAITVGATVTLLMLVGLQVPFDSSIGDYYARHSYTAAHGHNIVNVILVDFRALDTLGEISVICMAGLGVYALLRLRWKRADGPDKED